MKQCIIRHLDYLIAVEHSINYEDYEDIVIQTLANFGDGTVDMLIERLEKVRANERFLRPVDEASIQKTAPPFVDSFSQYQNITPAPNDIIDLDRELE